MNGVIRVSSGVGHESGKPFVQIVWGREVAQFTPEEARAHALLILEVAEASVIDAFLMEFLTGRAGIEREHAARVMLDFREWRARMKL